MEWHLAKFSDFLMLDPSSHEAAERIRVSNAYCRVRNARIEDKRLFGGRKLLDLNGTPY